MSDREFLGSRPGPDPEDVPDLLRRLRERKARHKQRHIVHRAGVVVLGVFLVIAGVVMSGPGVPGPGIATIILGLFFLALEFERAERLLVRAIHWAERAAQRAERSSAAERVMAAGAGLLALTGFVVAAVLWDIPLLPLV